MKTFGYARVSTKDQHFDRQISALQSYGIAERDIITDKKSGKSFERPGYLALKNQMLRAGDNLVITSLDRLGRNYNQIKEEFRELHSAGVNIIVLDMPVLSTADKTDLEKNLISNIVFELLAYTADKERRNIKCRQAEGIKASKEKGVKFGRPPVAAPLNFADECARWRAGEQTAVETMRRLGLKRTTFYKLIKQSSIDISEPQTSVNGSQSKPESV